MNLAYLFDPNKQFQDLKGVNNVAGFLRVYYGGTDDRATTYKNFIGTLNPADIPIDNNGRAVVIVEDEKTYRLEVYSKNGNLMWTTPPISCIVSGGGSLYQVQSNWDEDDPTSAAFIKNKPDLSAVATSGDYNDLSNKPTIEEVPTASTAIPSMDGIASSGSSTQWSRGDHVHPTDTSREATANKTTTVRQNGQADNTKFPTEAAVRTAIDSAVSSAYHAAGTKTVAQLTSSLLVSANEGDVYNITDSGTTTSDFIEGAGHPISVGDNVVVCDVGGGVYKFDLLSGFVDLTNYLTKTGDGSDVTASFTAASTRTNVTTGEKLSVLFGKIAKWFSDLKALAFKDKVNTSDIDDDAVTADKVKDGETLPANVTGSAKSLSSSLCSYGSSGSKFRLVAKSAPLGNTVNVHFEYRISASNYNFFQSATLQFNAVYSESLSSIVFSNSKVINDYGSSNLWKFYLVPNVAEQKVEIYAESTGSNYNSLNLLALFANGESQNYINGTTYFNTVVNSIPTPNVVVPVRTAVSTETGAGNVNTPVYIDNKGVPQPCSLKGVYFSQYDADSLSNIRESFDNGLLVYSKHAGDVYLLLDADSNGATFTRNVTVYGKSYYSTLTVDSNNVWSNTTEKIFNNIIVRRHYGENHEASVITTATDISNGYVEYALDFTDMYFGAGLSVVFVSLPNESTLAYRFTNIEVMTYPYGTGNSVGMCKFTDLTHADDGNAIGANDEYTWIRTCNSPNYVQRIKGLKLRCYLKTTSGIQWQAGIELKLKLDFNAVRFDKL